MLCTGSCRHRLNSLVDRTLQLAGVPVRVVSECSELVHPSGRGSTRGWS